MALLPKITPILIPPLTSFVDVRNVLMQKLSDLQTALVSAFPPTDMQGSRVSNVGPPQQDNDAVNLAYLRQSVAGIAVQLGTQVPVAPPPVVYTTVIQSDLGSLATAWGSGHIGSLALVSDYAHVLQWTGTGWQRGPGDTEHSDTFHWFGSAPGDVGWHPCDGSAVTYLQYDGTLGTRVLPFLTTPEYVKAGTTYSPTPTPAGSIIISGLTDSSAAGISVSTGPIPTGTGATVDVVTGVSDPGHTHGLTNGTATATLSGDPVDHIPMILYYRK